MAKKRATPAKKALKKVTPGKAKAAAKKSAPKKVKKTAKKLSPRKAIKKPAKKMTSSRPATRRPAVKRATAVKRSIAIRRATATTVKKVKSSGSRAANEIPTVDSALRFLSALALPPSPPATRAFVGEDVITFTTEKSESLIVGSDIVSFAAGLPDSMRTVITNSLLLAQLAASKKVGDAEKTTEWYKMYFNVLTTLGWVIQQQGFTEHEEKGKDFEVHKAILAVATTVFTGGATALAIITSTLNALETMGEGPWLTIFKKRSQRGKVAQFQVTVVEPIGDGGCQISLMAFELEGKNSLTQVLFFKFNSSSVTLKHASGTVTLDKQMVDDLGPAIANKVRPFQLEFISNIPIGEV